VRNTEERRSRVTDKCEKGGQDTTTHFVILFDVNLSGASSQSVKTGNINKITTLGRGDFGRQTKWESLYVM